MATIKTAISLYDGVTSPLKSIQQKSGNAVEVSAIQTAREELTRAGTVFDSIEDSVQRANSQQQSFNENIRGGASAADSLWTKIKGAAAAGLAAGKLVGRISDDLANTNARLDNARIQFTDEGSLTELEQKVMASAQRSRAAYMDTVAAVANLGQSANGVFGSMDEVVGFAELINKQFVIGGASAQESSAAMLQLTQAMSSGVLQEDGLNSVFENAPGIIQSIADYLGVPIGQIREMAAEGQITADIVKNATFASADGIETRFSTMSMTWGQIWTGMQNTALSVFSPILERINALANSAQFAVIMNILISGLAGIAQIAAWVLTVMLGIATAVIDNWSWIGPIIYFVAGAMLLYQTYTLLAGAAQAVLNALQSTSPVFWIVIGIIALIAALAAVCNWIAKTTGAAQTGFGIITGGIFVVGATFKNLGLMVANIALGIWEAFKACCFNLDAVFHNTISTIKSWFYGLLSTACTVIAGICEALNKLPFIEFDYSGIASAADNYAAKAAAAAKDKKEYKSISDAFDKGMSTYDAFQSGWVSEAFQSGAAWGDGLMGKLSGLLDTFNANAFDPSELSFDTSGYLPDTSKISPDTSGLGAGVSDPGTGVYDLGNNLEGIYDNTGDTAGSAGNTAQNTAAMADTLDVMEEDMAYLLDIAEREAINRFTTAEIKIEQTNHNSIAGNLDVDGIMDAWAADFAEKLDVSMEGVPA